MISEQLARIHDSIFHKDPYYLGYLNPNWQKVILPFQGNFHKEDFLSIELMAQQSGDTYMLVTDYEAEPFHSELEKCPISLNAYYNSLAGAKGDLYIRIFGLSGQWGIVVTRDYVTLVGGEETIIRRFISSQGGIEKMKSRFLSECQGVWLENEVNEKLLREIGWLE